MLTARKLRRAEIWTGYTAAGGRRTNVLGDLTEARALENLEGSPSLSLAIPLTSASAAALVKRAIVRIDQDDTPTFDEWRVVRVVDDRQSGLRTAVCADLRTSDMAEAPPVSRADGDGVVTYRFESVGLTPAEHIAQWVLPALAAAGLVYVVAGTITPTQRIDLTFDWTSPLAVLRMIAESTGMELDVRRVGTTGYAIDLLPKIGASAATVDLRLGRNLGEQFQRQEDTTAQATRLYPKGATNDDEAATISRATWQVTALALRANYIPWSTAFDNAAWTKRNGHVVTTADAVVAPNGTTTADLITATGTVPGSLQGLFTDRPGPNGPWAESLYVRAGAGVTDVRLILKDAASDTVRGTGTVTLTAAWQRIKAFGVTAGATAGLRLEFQALQDGTFYAWQAQGEVGTEVTDPIITFGTSPLTAPNNAVVTLADPAGGAGPVGFDDQLVGPNAGAYLAYAFESDSAVDTSGQAHHGVLQNGPTFASARGGRVIVLDGLNDYVEVANAAALEYIGLTDLTLAAWVYQDPTDVTLSYVFSRPWTGSGDYNYKVALEVGGYVTFNLGGLTVSTISTQAGSWTKGVWHHVAVTVEAATNIMRIYIDGVQQASGVHTIANWAAATGNAHLPLAIGTLYPYGGAWAGDAIMAMNGMLDDVRVYPARLLSATDVQRLAGAAGKYGAYLRRADGTLTAVVESRAVSQAVTIADSTGVAVGDLVQFREDAAGRDLNYLDNPADVNAYGLKVGALERSDLPSTNNRVKNPATRSWPQNLALQSRSLGSAPWGNAATTAQNAVGVDGGANNATTVTDGSAVNFQDRTQQVTIPNDTGTHSLKFWIAKDAVTTRAPQLRLTYSGGSVPASRSISLNTQTGAFVDANLTGIGANAVVDGTPYGHPNWWLCTITVQNNGTGHTLAALTVYPAARTTYNGADDVAATGSVVVGQVQFELYTSLGTNAPQYTTTTIVGVAPANWSVVGTPTVTKQVLAPLTRYGTQSAKVVATADGQGLISDAVPITPTALAPYVSGFAEVWPVSGNVRVELVFTTPGGPKVFPAPPNFATPTNLGQWAELGASGYDAFTAGATAVQIRVVQHGATASTFYLDGAQVTESAAQLPFVEGSGPTQLWQAANAALADALRPAITYDLSLLDLERLDPVTFGPDCTIILGAPARINDASMSALAVLTRIVQYQRDYFRPALTTVTLSTLPNDLTGLLSEQARARRLAAGTLDTTATNPLLDVTVSHASGNATITWTSSYAGVQLSINSGAYSAAPASPIVVTRPAAGGLPLEYSFKLDVGSEEVIDTVTILPIDQDTNTVTPDLVVSPQNPTTTQQEFVISATNPSGGAAPSLFVLLKGTTGTGSVSGAFADGVEKAAASGETITVNRPTWGTVAQASASFRATISGQGTERIQRSITTQVKTSFGPSFEVYAQNNLTNTTISYTVGGGTLQLSINNGANSPAPASPIVVTRPLPGQPSLDYTFTLTADGQTIGDSITVPAQDMDSPLGVEILANPEWRDQGAGISIYDNAAGGRIFATIVADATAPNSSGVLLRISYDAAVNQNTNISPGYGGFTHAIGVDTGVFQKNTYHKGSRIRATLKARIPAGYVINYTQNAPGSGATITWLTPQGGTGAWVDYIVELTIGTSGTFGVIGYWYLSHPTINTPGAGLFWDAAKSSFVNLDMTPIPADIPDLSIAPQTPSAVNQPFIVSAVNPTKGVAPTVFVLSAHTTADVYRGGVYQFTTTANVESQILSGDLVYGVRQAFGTTNVASLRFRAALPGGGQETITYPVPNQVKTSFGPSLDVQSVVASSTIVTVTYSSTGTIEYAGNSGTYVTPPASPFNITRPSAGSEALKYTFRATLDGQTVSTEIFVPAQAAAAGYANRFTSVSLNGNSSTNNMTVTWSWDGDPSASFTVISGNDGTPNNVESESASSGYSYSSTYDLIDSGGTVHTFRVKVEARVGANVVATGVATVTFRINAV